MGTFSEPGGTRTLDHRIKSPMLYQLSYWLSLNPRMSWLWKNIKDKTSRPAYPFLGTRMCRVQTCAGHGVFFRIPCKRVFRSEILWYRRGPYGMGHSLHPACTLAECRFCVSVQLGYARHSLRGDPYILSRGVHPIVTGQIALQGTSDGHVPDSRVARGKRDIPLEEFFEKMDEVENRG